MAGHAARNWPIGCGPARPPSPPRGSCATTPAADPQAAARASFRALLDALPEAVSE